MTLEPLKPCLEGKSGYFRLRITFFVAAASMRHNQQKYFPTFWWRASSCAAGSPPLNIFIRSFMRTPLLDVMGLFISNKSSNQSSEYNNWSSLDWHRTSMYNSGFWTFTSILYFSCIRHQSWILLGHINMQPSWVDYYNLKELIYYTKVKVILFFHISSIFSKTLQASYFHH